MQRLVMGGGTYCCRILTHDNFPNNHSVFCAENGEDPCLTSIIVLTSDSLHIFAYHGAMSGFECQLIGQDPEGVKRVVYVEITEIPLK